jgi:hypothetical protein
VTHTQIDAELGDFTSSVENDCHPPLDTSEHDIACCPQFATEHLLNVGDLQSDVVFQGFYSA